MPKVTMEIEQGIYDQLEEALKNLTRPPIREAERIVAPLAYPNGVPDWVAEVMENNIANVVRHQPSPQMKALQDEAAALEQRIRVLMRPTVSLART